MSELVGILRGREIYDNDSQLAKLQCDVEYIPVYHDVADRQAIKRCDYCKRKGQRSGTCESCGASL